MGRAARELYRRRIGDPERQRAQLDEVSPLRHADRVGVPVFISHGMKDIRVLPSHSGQMVEALRAHGKPVEWLPLEYHGHHIPEGATRRKYFAALLKFLERHLGPMDDSTQEPGAQAAAPVTGR